MPLVISDESLRAAGVTEQEAKVEIACRWFDAGNLSFQQAAAFAGLMENEFETAIATRHIPRYRYTEEMLAGDVEALKNWAGGNFG